MAIGIASGQGATDPETGKLVSDDVEKQTEQCLKNVQAILRAGGSDLQYVLRCGVFLLDMKEFQRMNSVYSRMFGIHRPARTTIQAAVDAAHAAGVHHLQDHRHVTVSR